MHWKMTDKEKYTALMQRYWEAETTPEEERELARYAAWTEDSEFEQLRGVLGFLSVGRERRTRRIQLHQRYAWAAVAAVVVITAGLGLSFHIGILRPESERCVRQAYGSDPITDRELIMASVEATLTDFFADDSPAETNLIEMFQR